MKTKKKTITLNILIKLTCLIGLVVAPILGGHSDEGATNIDINKEVKIEANGNNDEMAIATITTTKTVDGKTVTDTKTIKGTLEEIEKKAKEAGDVVSVKVQKTGKEIKEEVKVIVEKQN